MLANHQGPNVHNEDIELGIQKIVLYVVLAFRILVSEHIFMAVVL